MCPVATNLADLVMSRCDELAACSEDSGCITRRFLTAPMQEVHDRLGGWMRQAGLQIRVDNGGNLIGRRHSEGATRTLIVGSHLDTVPGGGRYDGVLGVLLGLAVAENLSESQLPFHLDIIGFSEEEGVRYSKPYLGSSAVAGVFLPEWLERVDDQGVTMREAIAGFGLDPDNIATAAYSREEVVGYVEAHLEQGPVLEDAGAPLGVVSGIAGQSRLRLEFRGEAGHAGTTPMLDRCDALAMAAEFVGEVRSLGRQTAGLRATVGRVEVTPNATNVIPGRVELSLDVRHVEDSVREQAVNDLLVAGKRIVNAVNGSFVLLERTAQQAVKVDGNMSELLAKSISRCGHEPLQLVSGAGHDAVVMAQRFPIAMLFLRHPGGVSHHPDERVERDDVAVAIEVMSQFATRLAETFASGRHI
ncbi:MAG: allantoate amidohydrolase [Planctomycetes bacterium]|nr:allantoate amidohydrolase [Planctomycetota bacterium]